MHLQLKTIPIFFNECLINGKFPNTLKRADISLSEYALNLSKGFEKLLFEQINDHMRSKLFFFFFSI